MSPNAFRAVLIGADSLLLECGDVLLDKGHDVVAVLSDAPKVRAWSARRGLRALATSECLMQLAPESFDYLFAITHLAILPDALLALPRLGAINFHDGPLPRYAGLNAPAWALMRGETRYGISWHEIRGGIDEGDILKQREFEIAPGETSLSLNTRNFAAAIESFSELVDELAQGRSTRTAQDLSRRSYFGKHLRPQASALLAFDRPARELAALVRGLDFGEYENALGVPKLVHRGKWLSVRAAEAIADDGGSAAGTVLSLDDGAIAIAAMPGTLRILELARPCGTRLPLMAAAELLAIEPGVILEALPQPLAAALSEGSEKVARAEPFWSARLRSLEPATLALAQAERADGSRALVALDVPVALREPSRLLTAFAIYVARTSGKTQCDFGYRSRRDEGGLGMFFSPQVPLRFVLDEARSFDELCATFSAELAEIDDKPSFLRDLIARSPALRASPELAA
ncbi:MAG TPA: formyltransferase family protein, partial [Polyangiales bacterium]